MISTNLSGRIERLERQIQPRIKDIKLKIQSQATTNLLRRLNQARRRMALEGDERYAAYRNLPEEPEVHAPSTHPTELVMRLNAARKRMNQENELARQAAGTAAAMEESEITDG